MKVRYSKIARCLLSKEWDLRQKEKSQSAFEHSNHIDASSSGASGWAVSQIFFPGSPTCIPVFLLLKFHSHCSIPTTTLIFTNWKFYGFDKINIYFYTSIFYQISRELNLIIGNNICFPLFLVWKYVPLKKKGITNTFYKFTEINAKLIVEFQLNS